MATNASAQPEGLDPQPAGPISTPMSSPSSSASSSPSPSPKPARKKRSRRWLKALLGLIAIAGALIAALPWILSQPFATRYAVAQLNAMIAPGRAELESARLSWNSTIELKGLALHDPNGKKVLSAATATLDRGVWRLIAGRPDYGTLTIDGAEIDIERRADGSIDLLDSVQTLMTSSDSSADASKAAEPFDPRLRFSLKANGRLTLRTPELSGPLVAERADLTLIVPPGDEPISCEIGLANSESETIALKAAYGKSQTMDLKAAIKAQSWPFAAESAGAVARGRLDGQIQVALSGSDLLTLGDAVVTGLQVEGEPLAGDRLKLDKVDGHWKIERKGEIWKVEKLDVASPALTASASMPSPSRTQIKADIDLAALSKQIPRAMHLAEGRTLDQGNAQFDLALSHEGTVQTIDLTGNMTDLAVRAGDKVIELRDPARFSIKARRDGDKAIVEEATARIANDKTSYLDLQGKGDLDQGIELKGIIDFDGLQSRLEQVINFEGRKFSGRAGLAMTCKRAQEGYKAWLGMEMRRLKIVGHPAASVLPDPLERQTGRLDLTVYGPVGESRLPEDWRRAEAVLRTNQEAISSVVERRGEGVAVAVSGQGHEKLMAGSGNWVVKTTGQWSGQAADIAALEVALKHDDKTVPELNLALKGRCDLGSGTAELVPTNADKPSSLNLTPSGLKVSGLNGDVIQAEGGLTGDLNAINALIAAWVSGPAAPSPAPAATATATAAAAPAPPSPEPVSLTFRGSYRLEPPRADFETAELTSRYAAIQANGSIDDPIGKRIADLRGTILPNDSAVSDIAAQYLEPKAKMKIEGRPFRIQGSMAGSTPSEILKGMDAELALDLVTLEAYGLKLEQPAAVSIQCVAGEVKIAPILTRINGGDARLNPVFPLDDPRGLSLRLAQGSSLKNVRINDEVSKQLLAYVAPILHEATRVEGQVSLTLDRAELPLTGDTSRGLTLAGQLVFEDVACVPGPAANQLIAMTGRDRPTALRLRQPVQLEVANNRVIQKGLTIPIEGKSEIQLAGSVGFDQTLKLQATIPVTPDMFGGKPKIAANLLEGSKIVVPVAGTLTRPQIDRRVAQTALREIGQTLIKRGIRNEAGNLLEGVLPGASELLDGLQGKPDPSANAASGTNPDQDVVPGPRPRANTNKKKPANAARRVGDALKALDQFLEPEAERIPPPSRPRN